MAGVSDELYRADLLMVLATTSNFASDVLHTDVLLHADRVKGMGMGMGALICALIIGAKGIYMRKSYFQSRAAAAI